MNIGNGREKANASMKFDGIKRGVARAKHCCTFFAESIHELLVAEFFIIVARPKSGREKNERGNHRDGQ